MRDVHSVWVDQQTQRVMVENVTTGRRLVVHLPSLVLLLDTGPTK